MEDNIKPYWEQIMIEEKMTIEEAETIIDDMYQDRHKIIEEGNGRGVTIHVDKLDDVKFTNLEFASVRALREIQSLRRKVENSIPEFKIKNLIAQIESAIEFMKTDKTKIKVVLSEQKEKDLRLEIMHLKKLMEEK